MKKSGAPEVGDLVRYFWISNEGHHSEFWHEVTALVVGERGIWVRILPFGEMPAEHAAPLVPGPERWIVRAQCEIIGS